MGFVSGLFTTPDLITQITAAVFFFAVIFGILVICLRFLPIAKWTLIRQRTFVWLVATVTGVLLVFMPHAIRIMTR